VGEVPRAGGAPVAQRVTIGLALSTGRDRLAAAGCDTARLDAELLLAHALGVGRERLILDRDGVPSGDALHRYEVLLERREVREPVAYIVGHREFRRLGLAVDRRVLIPRPETELLVEVGLELGPEASVVDVGTGSGAVALALKDERPDLVVRGLDISEGAVAVARANAARLGLDVEFACCDLLDEGIYDAVLANLPYVADGAWLEPEIALHEPASALFAGPDGLDVIARLVTMAAGRTGLMGLEIDPPQAAAVSALLRGAGFSAVQIRRDLAGHDRVVVGAA
jgi:release factor glutamine methyltransferase